MEAKPERAGGMNLIDSGSITTFDGEPIVIIVESSDAEDKIRLKIDFIDDNGDPDIDSEFMEEKGVLEITILNHRKGHSGNMGPDVPIKIGNFNNDLYLMYGIFNREFEDGDVTTMEYSFYEDEEQKMGE
jgi:hypothetical protein